MAQSDAKVYVNVQVGEEDKARIARQEKTWNGTRLVLYCLVFLAACLVVLYLMSSTTSETTWSDWLFPWPTGKNL